MYTHRCDSKINIYVLVGRKTGYVIMEHTSAAGYVIFSSWKKWTENVDNRAVQLYKSRLGRSLPWNQKKQACARTLDTLGLVSCKECITQMITLVVYIITTCEFMHLCKQRTFVTALATQRPLRWEVESDFRGNCPCPAWLPLGCRAEGGFVELINVINLDKAISGYKCQIEPQGFMKQKLDNTAVN